MKRLVVLLCLFLCIGCTTQNDSDITDKQLNTYHSIIQKLENTDGDIPKDFTIEYTFHKVDDYYRYDMILKDSTISMYDIIAVSYSHTFLDSYHPSIGLFDKTTYSIVPGVIDRNNGFYKGLGLSGRTSRVSSLKLYISYYEKENSKKRVEYIYEVENAS